MQTLANHVLCNNAAGTALATLDQAAASLQSGFVTQSMEAVYRCLRYTRDNMSDEDWAGFARYAREHHPLRSWVHQDPFTKRACDKPRGYAGDAVMMDYLYGIHSYHEASAEASPLGREICEYVRRCPAPSAVRFRREHIAQLIDRAAAGGSRPSVLAVAAGHLREAEISNAVASGRLGRFVALDADAESLRDVETHYSHLGVETVHGSVRQLLAHKLRLGAFDFVYAAGLYDYLADNVAQALSACLFEMVNPGGQMLIPNFAPQVWDRGFMETFMDWNLTYRDEYDMSKLLARVNPAEIESYDIYDDPTGSVVYLLVKKKGQAHQ